ncbi:MAG: type II toxin-antitoxin system HicA family toxin [Candidatus Wallbacteria bacterium]|nr:type II toxin-antitoxin system HicA family toxin [Candidatus Wallbacteria bacterium]
MRGLVEREGWRWEPGNGSHRRYASPRHPGIRFTVSYHRKQMLRPKTLREIARLAGWENVP